MHPGTRSWASRHGPLGVLPSRCTSTPCYEVGSRRSLTVDEGPASLLAMMSAGGPPAGRGQLAESEVRRSGRS
jgi:hypothetical protein